MKEGEVFIAGGKRLKAVNVRVLGGGIAYESVEIDEPPKDGEIRLTLDGEETVKPKRTYKRKAK